MRRTTLALSILYERSHELPRIIALFAGLQVIVVASVANATYYFGKGSVKDLRSVLIAACSCVLLFYSISPFVIIIAAGVSGVLLFRSTNTFEASHVIGKKDGQYLKPLALFVSLIAAGVAVLYFVDPELCSLTLLMFKVDMFAFGGGFSSVPLMLHEIVDVCGWMNSKTFMDGIALGQVTPGPIVITSTFVGYLLHGLTGAIVATIAIFTPSFLMVVLLTPALDKLKSSVHFTGATKGILASFVGLLFFVSVKFALDVHWDGPKLLLALAAFIALSRKVDVAYVVLIASLISVIIFVRG